MEATSYMWYFKPKFKNAVPHTRCISVAHLPHGVSGYRTGECGHGMFLSPQTVPWLLIYSHYNWAWAYIHLFLFSYEFFIYYGYKSLTRSDFGKFAPIVWVFTFLLVSSQAQKLILKKSNDFFFPLLLVLLVLHLRNHCSAQGHKIYFCFLIRVLQF